MKLIIHPGWSKTGTSAIQNGLHSSRDALLKAGICYPLACQWGDHSHHHFSLAFGGNAAHRGQYSIEVATKLVIEEFKRSEADVLLLSSELSPFYFSIGGFDKFLKEAEITDVELIFTVREQGSLLLSMHNQLIKDPVARSKKSLFETYLNISSWMNFDIQIKRWENKVGKENIKVIKYNSQIVKDFFDVLGVDVDTEKLIRPVNQSIPLEILDFSRKKLIEVNNPGDYKINLDEIIQQYKNGEFVDQGTFLISESELKAIYQYYLPANQGLSRKYFQSEKLFSFHGKAVRNFGPE